jgi:hypothetical protein
MSLRSKRIVGLALGGLVTVSAAVAPAAAQGLNVIAPTHPTWARWLDLQTGSEFVLCATRRQIQIANFQEPRRVRLCVTSGASHLAARAVTEDGESSCPWATAAISRPLASPWYRRLRSAETGASKACTTSSAERLPGDRRRLPSSRPNFTPIFGEVIESARKFSRALPTGRV